MSTILFVEDNQKQRKHLLQCALAANKELEMLETGSYKEALTIIKENLIDVFFIDIQLKDGNGIELARTIRAMPEYQFAPIIFITGLLTKEMEAFHEIHCYDYIIKPFSKRAIINVMKHILQDYFYKRHEPAYIQLNYRGLIQKVNTNNVIYVEKRERKIVILTKNEEILYKHMTIKEIKKALPDNFIQVHQSFLVNKKLIKKIDLNNNWIRCESCEGVIPIGVSFRKKVVELIYDSI